MFGVLKLLPAFHTVNPAPESEFARKADDYLHDLQGAAQCLAIAREYLYDLQDAGNEQILDKHATEAVSQMTIILSEAQYAIWLVWRFSYF